MTLFLLPKTPPLSVCLSVCLSLSLTHTHTHTLHHHHHQTKIFFFFKLLIHGTEKAGSSFNSVKENKAYTGNRCGEMWGVLRWPRGPALVAYWLVLRTAGQKVLGSNPIRVMWDFSALTSSYPEPGVPWAQQEGWDHTAELHPLHRCVFIKGVALIT